MNTDANTTKFLAAVKSLDGMFYRLDSGRLTGRNGDSFERTLAWRFEQANECMRAALASDAEGLCEYLDTHPAAAAKWNRLERRMVGLAV